MVAYAIAASVDNTIDADLKLSNKSNLYAKDIQKSCVVESKLIEANKNNRSRRSLPWRKVGYKEECIERRKASGWEKKKVER